MCKFLLHLYTESQSIPPTEYSLDKVSALEVGRGSRCKIYINNGCISRVQCGIYLRKNDDDSKQWLLVDGNLVTGRASQNGTFLNGKRLKNDRAYTLKNQSKITFGGQNFPLIVFIEKQNNTNEEENPTLSCEREF